MRPYDRNVVPVQQDLVELRDPTALCCDLTERKTSP